MRTGLLAATCVLAAPALLAQPAAPAAPSSAELFEQAFGARRARAATQRLSLPTQLDGREIGVVAAEVGPSVLRLSRAELATALAQVLRADLLARLREPSASPWIEAAALADQVGVKAVYSPQRIALDLEIALAQRMRRTLRVQRAAAQEEAAPTPLPAQPWSVIANTRWLLSGGTGGDRFRMLSDWAWRQGDWVMEGVGTLPLDGVGQPSRGDVRLVRDWTDQAIRLQLGDVTQLPRAGQSLLPVAGLRLGRQFRLNPNAVFQALPGQALGLPNGGAVDVLVNGFLVRSLRLGPGVYDLREIPQFNGSNDVQLRITEPGGRVSVQRFDNFFDGSLLAQGVSDWDLSLGFPLRPGVGSRQYDTAAPTGGGWWRQGLRDDLTVGGGWQFQRRGDMAQAMHVEATWATAAGTWAGWLARSARPLGTGHQVTLQWRWNTVADPLAAWSASLAAQWQRRDAAWAPVGATVAAGAGQDLALRAGWVGADGLSLALTWSRRQAALQPLASTSNLALRWRLDRQWSMEVGASTDRGGSTGRRDAVFMNLRFTGERDPSGQQASAAASFSTLDARRQLEAQVNGVSAFAGADAAWRVATLRAQSLQGTDSRLSGEVWTPRTELSWAASQTMLNGVRNDYQELSVATALIASSAGLLVSAPVPDSAAILQPRQALQGSRVLVDPQRAGAVLQSDWFGHPVVPNLVSYSPRDLQIDVDPLPPGADLGVDRPLLRPPYKSVTLVPVGSDANTQVRARMLGASGRPLGLRAYQIQDAERRTPPIDVFTSRQGALTSPPLPGGRYLLVRPEDGVVLARWRIEAGQAGIVSLGEIKEPE